MINYFLRDLKSTWCDEHSAISLTPLIQIPERGERGGEQRAKDLILVE